MAKQAKDASPQQPEAPGNQSDERLARIVSEAVVQAMASTGNPRPRAVPTASDWDLFVECEHQGYQFEVQHTLNLPGLSNLHRWFDYMHKLLQREPSAKAGHAEAQHRFKLSLLNARLVQLRADVELLNNIQGDWELSDEHLDLIEKLAGPFGKTDQGQRKRIVLEEQIGRFTVGNAIVDVEEYQALWAKIEATEAEIAAAVPPGRRAVLDRGPLLERGRKERESLGVTA